jgi:hypothetical protein
MSTVKVLARDYKKFYLSFFGVMTALYIVGFILTFSGSTVRVGGIEGVYLLACLFAGMFGFREDYFFLAQNQIPKSTMTKAFVIEGFSFGLLTSAAVSIFSYIMQLISSALGTYLPNFLDLIPTWVKMEGVAGLGRMFVTLLFLYLGTYFTGLMIGTINYRLNWIGRIILWVPLGVITLNGIIGVAQHLDSTRHEDMEVISVALVKPFIYALEWLMQSLGNFVIASTVAIILSIVVGALVFRGAEVKYSNVK